MECPPTNRYSTLAARVYHLDKPIGRSFGDIEFYTSCLGELDGPVFEPAVGTGRVLIPLREKGIRISGSDPSLEMLKICAQELTSRGLEAELDVGTFESIPQDRSFGAVIIPAGSIQLVTEPRDTQSIFNNVRTALKTGGEFIFDLDPLVSLTKNNAYSRYWEDADEAITMTSTPERTDFLSQVTVAQLRYEVWRSGVLQQSELDRFALRFWSVNEVRLALEQSGFGDIRLVADYVHGKKVTAESQIITVAARKV